MRQCLRQHHRVQSRYGRNFHQQGQAWQRPPVPQRVGPAGPAFRGPDPVGGTFEHHLAGCNPCQIVVDNIRKTITLYKEGKAYEMPLEFKQRLHADPQDVTAQVYRLAPGGEGGEAA